MHAIRIVLLCIGAAVLYGIAHDQITARVCVEYFTIGHPPIFGTEDPTLLGIGWGIVATWWVGLLLGVPLAMAARAGSRPKRSARSLIRPLACLLGITALCALTAGLLGWFVAQTALPRLLNEQIPPPKAVAFLADLWAHSTSYLVGFVGGIVLMIHVWRSRSHIQRSAV